MSGKMGVHLRARDCHRGNLLFEMRRKANLSTSPRSMPRYESAYAESVRKFQPWVCSETLGTLLPFDERRNSEGVASFDIRKTSQLLQSCDKKQTFAQSETNYIHRDAVDLDQRIQQALYSAGLVTEIKPPVKRPRERHPPINIKGKPLSETIIEDRR